MPGRTPRRWILLGTAGAVGVATAVAAALGQERIALAGVVALLLVAIGTSLLLDRRQRAQLRAIRSSAARDRKKVLARLEDLTTAAERRRVEANRRNNRLKAELAQARDDLARLDDLGAASFRATIRQYVREVRAEARLRPWPPSSARQLPLKLRNIELAASHGVDVPEIYAVWPDVDAIDLSGLPDRFVLKADGGAGSVAVFPLERLPDGRFRKIGSAGETTADEIRARIRQLGGRARPPYFAEELLHGIDGDPIPNDVKLYMFYGEVGQILVRTVGEHADASSIRLKFVDENGMDFGEVAIGRPHDPAIPVPASLPELVAVSRHLSRAVGLPFCRVDLYETSRGVVLGEITRAPSGGNEFFTTAQDQMLGRAWLESQARLTADLSAGRPWGPLFGERADLHLYPARGGDRDPSTYPRTVLPCDLWCSPQDVRAERG